jgi:hypothetical protein
MPAGWAVGKQVTLGTSYWLMLQLEGCWSRCECSLKGD